MTTVRLTDSAFYRSLAIQQRWIQPRQRKLGTDIATAYLSLKSANLTVTNVNDLSLRGNFQRICEQSRHAAAKLVAALQCLEMTVFCPVVSGSTEF